MTICFASDAPHLPGSVLSLTRIPRPLSKLHHRIRHVKPKEVIHAVRGP